MRILIADDDPDFRGLASRALRREFVDCTITEIGDRAGLETALAEPPPDLLVSDLNLNWIDGFGILAAVQTRAPRCPAIMFTGTGNEEVAVRAIKEGFDDYVVKSPKQLRRLAAAARAAVTRAETRRHLEENRDLLTQELYHRLHNNLQLVVGLIAFTAREIGDPEARWKLETLGRRVQSLSLLQESLYRGGDFRRVEFHLFLRRMAEDLLGLEGQRVEARLELMPVVLPVDLAVPLALIANEWITAGLLHAAPPPRIAVVLHETEGLITLEVTAGGGAAADGGGLGTRLVDRLARQIGGVVEAKPESDKKTCRIIVRAPSPLA
ncbi:response regulator [Belnapia sp. T6]|uniref:histidine kinase n=1 Tax=Belnapia mucosa TaxID=2804532 RepID=A0ABS1V3I4_9PROT|nr:response regulator [Belnapia mucosa]MBL6456249.1 response regulator [Belnapia mucosa]